MRRTLIMTLSVLICALALALAGQSAVNAAVEDALRLQSLAVLAANNDDSAQARTQVAALAGLWRERAGLLEILASHDALHEVAAAIAEAQICLECEDHDDFLRTMSTAALALDHLKDEQAVRWGNLY